MGFHNEDTLFESPFRERFNTNYVPSDVEIDLIRAHLAPHEAELVRLESLIRDLTVQRDRVKAHIDSHKALISQPRRLPQDVIEQIFLACLPTRHNAVMSVTEAPLLLGHICSAWRSITFAMPRLWASLHISVDFAFSEERQAVIVDWLMRSAPLPLAISASCHDYDHYDQAVVNILSAFSPRWYALNISNIPPEDFALMAALDAPLLTDIQITSEYDYAQERFHILTSNFLHGNSRKVTITFLDLRSLVPTTPFTWDHLTDLTLQHNKAESFGEVGFLDCEAVYQLLKGCTHLRSLKIPIRLSDQHAHQTLLLPSLESLVIFNDIPSLEVFRYLLDLLVMPLLSRFHLFNHLHLDFDEDRPVVTIEFLERFAARSPVISDLYLDLSDLHTTPFMRILHPFPCLESLRLVLWTPDSWWTSAQLDTAELLGTLTPGSSPCPALKDLIVETDEFADDIWVNFLQMHLDHRTSLRKFNLHCWRDPPKIMPDVERFLAGGLAVSLEYTAFGEDVQPTPWQGIEC
ncbi:hypothetical protein K438DRAFT_1672658 [Mycena galopus ATCC 62051]|nr:hypothetical protein K438DRAFT_1672658 [Mycena galopus ATCC 62051]